MNKKEAKQWLADHPHPSLAEVMVVLQSMVKDINGRRNYVRDVEVLNSYCSGIPTRHIAYGCCMSSPRVRQIVKEQLRVIKEHICKLEHAGDWKAFYSTHPFAQYDNLLTWACRCPDVILARTKYLILKHAIWE